MLRSAPPRLICLVSLLLVSCGGETPTEPAVVATVDVTPASVALSSFGATAQLTANARTSSGTAIPGKTFNWSSSDAGVATVSSTGAVTAIADGTTTVTATTGGVSGTATVVVEQAVAEVDVQPSATTLTSLGAAIQLVAEARDGMGNAMAGIPFVWSSSDDDLVTVSVDGEATAVSEGVAVVTATAEGITGQGTVTVDQTVSTVAVSPATPLLTALGQTVDLVAEGRDAGGSVVPDAVFTWATSDAATATVTAEGQVAAVQDGTATISATSHGVAGTATVTVDQVVHSVAVTPQADTLVVSASTVLSVEARDELGSIVADATFVWTSAEPGIATVTQTGTVTGVGPGLTSITATSEGVFDQSAITVLAPPSVACSALVSGSIGVAGETDVYTFAGEAGDVVSLTIVETTDWGGSFGANAARVRVLSPTLVEVDLFDSNGQHELTLSESGQYTVRVQANNLVSTGGYNLGLECIVAPSPDPTALTLGSLISAQITLAGESDLFTFDASTGDIVSLTIVEATDWGGSFGANAARLTLFSPAGAQLQEFDSNAQNEYTLPSDGTYVVRVSANNLVSTGSYNIGLEGIVAPSPTPTALTLGSLVSAQLTLAGESDLFTFDASTGDIVSLTIVETTDWGGSFGANAARLTLFNPAGVQLQEFDSNAQNEYTLPATGAYLIRVSANNLVSTGSYNIGLEGIVAPSPTPTALTLGSLVSDQIVSGAESDLFTFSGSTGDIVSLTIVETTDWGGSFGANGARLTLFNPAGVQIQEFDSNAQNEYTLPTTGTFLIRVSANNLVSTGSYNIGLEGIAAPSPAPTALTLGSLVSDQIVSGAESDLFTFSGSTGDIVSLTIVETTDWGGSFGANGARLTLFNPSGTQIQEFDSNAQNEYTLPGTGTYLIRVSANNLVSTGSYNIGLEGIVAPSPTPTALTLGSLISDQIDGGAESDLFTFSGSTGDIVSLTIVETTDWGGSFGANGARLTLFNPAGIQIQEFDSNAQNEYTLPATGTYLIRVSANNLVSTGSYNIGLEGIVAPSPTPTALTLGSLVSDQIVSGAESDLFTFDGSSGDIVSLSIVETTDWGGSFGANGARLTLFNPSGVQIQEFDSNAQNEYTLPSTGTYLIRVSANNLVSTGDYNLGLEGVVPPSPTPTALALGSLLSEQIISGAESDLFTFSGSGGDIVSLTVVEATDWGGSFGANGARLTLFNPAGVQIQEFDSNAQNEYSLPSTGAFLVRVSANNLVSTGSYNVGLEGILPRSPTPTALPCGGNLAGTIGAPGASQLWTFDATAGSTITLTVAETPDWGGSFGANAALATVFSPSGTEIAAITSDGVQDIAIATTGSYTIRVSANTLVAIGDYQLDLQCS